MRDSTISLRRVTSPCSIACNSFGLENYACFKHHCDLSKLLSERYSIQDNTHQGTVHVCISALCLKLHPFLVNLYCRIHGTRIFLPFSRSALSSSIRHERLYLACKAHLAALMDEFSFIVSLEYLDPPPSQLLI